MIFILFLVYLLFSIPLFFSGSYLAELLISFLPYIVFISGFFVLIHIFFLKNNLKKKHKFSLYRCFMLLSFLTSCFLFFWYGKQFVSFYSHNLLPQEATRSGIKVLFANIHKDNTQYKNIEKLISDNDPDMLMFVEFAEHHYTHLKSFLQQRYPYVNSTTRSKKFIGNMAFSKYPLSNRANIFPQGMRRYGYFSLSYQEQEIYFYLVHTSSPDTHKHFLMRNNQLTTFVQNFKTHDYTNKQNNIVVVGDFNITPWSLYYDILAQAFSDKLMNITQHIPLLLTRKLKEFPFFFAHIDHLWATTGLEVRGFQTLTMPGSDHKAFLFTLSTGAKINY